MYKKKNMTLMADKKKIIVKLIFICWLLIVLAQITEQFSISKLVQRLHYENKVML